MTDNQSAFEIPEQQLLFSTDHRRVYACFSDRPNLLPAAALVVPLGSRGGLQGGFTRSLRAHLSYENWERVAASLKEAAQAGFDLEHPALVPLNPNIAAELLPHIPPGQSPYLIAAALAAVEDPLAWRLSAEVVLALAAESGIQSLIFPAPTAAHEPYRDWWVEAAANLLAGVWLASFSLPPGRLLAITLVTPEENGLGLFRFAAEELTYALEQVGGDGDRAGFLPDRPTLLQQVESLLSGLLHPETAAIGPDEAATGAEPPELLPVPPPPPSLTRLRVDAAVPDQVQVGRAFDLAVAVRQLSSPQLAEADLPQVSSGDVQLIWPDDEPALSLRIQVSAPDCEIHGQDSTSFNLFRGQDSPPFYFQLTPRQEGQISIVVTVFQEDHWLGGARIHTLAQEREAGRVSLEVTSATLAGQEEAALRQKMAESFNRTELELLAHDLAIDVEELPLQSLAKSELALELILYCDHHGRTADLLARLGQLRPQVEW